MRTPAPSPPSDAQPPDPHPVAKSSAPMPDEEDPVWSLLLQGSPRLQAPPSFAAELAAAAAAIPQVARPHSSRWLQTVCRRSSYAAAAAVLALSAAALWLPHPWLRLPASPPMQTVLSDVDSAELDEWTASETLIAAADDLDQLSDADLVELLGF